MGGGAPRSSCLGGETYFLSGAQPIHRFVSSASDSAKYIAQAPPSLYLKTRPQRSLFRSWFCSASEPSNAAHQEEPISFSRNPFLFSRNQFAFSMAESGYGNIWRAPNGV